MSRLRVILALALCALLTTVSAAGDLFDGTWQLNTAKSKYSPGPGPDKATVTIKTEGESVSVKTDSSFESKPIMTSYTVKLDGTPGSLEGSPVADTISVRKVDERTRALRTMKGDKTVGESRATISADGKTITVTGTGLNPKGEKVKFTAVYEKQ
jgi:hypothetical protein